MCDFDGGDMATLWTRKYPVAKKEHRCAACEGVIRPGRRYLALSTLFDGSWSSTKCCLPCERIEKKFAEEHRMSPHPDALADSLRTCIDEEPSSGKKWNPALRAMRKRRVPVAVVVA